MTNSSRSMMLSLVIGLVGFAVITAAQEDDLATVSPAPPALRPACTHF